MRCLHTEGATIIVSDGFRNDTRDQCRSSEERNSKSRKHVNGVEGGYYLEGSKLMQIPDGNV